MAKVIVSGEVDEVKETKTGKVIIQMSEIYPSQLGEQWVRKWSIWMPTGFNQVRKGDWLEVEGDLSTKAVEWVNKEGRTINIIDHNLNNPVIVQHKPEQLDTPRFNDDDDDRRKYGSGLAPF
jgi:hypothetical protein